MGGSGAETIAQTTAQHALRNSRGTATHQIHAKLLEAIGVGTHQDMEVGATMLPALHVRRSSRGIVIARKPAQA